MEQDLKTIIKSDNDGNQLIILVQSQAGETLAFGKMHPLSLHLNNGDIEVTCFSEITANVPRQGYGKLVMNEIKRHVETTGQTAIGFCATDLLPFYRACGCRVLQPEDNHFVYVDENNQIVPNLVPGEVVYYSGKDGIMDKILASKIIGISKNWHSRSVETLG